MTDPTPTNTECKRPYKIRFTVEMGPYQLFGWDIVRASNSEKAKELAQQSVARAFGNNDPTVLVTDVQKP